MRNYPCRLHPAPVLCILLPALRFKLSASCFMHSASSSPLMHQTLRFLLSAPCFLLSCTPLPASCSPLLASDFLPPALSALSPLLPALSALSHLLPASCFLRTLPLPFTLYSLLTASALSALCPQPSAFCSLSFNRHPPKNGLPGSCIGGVRAGTLPHTEKNACGVRPHVAPPRYLSATSLPSLHPG